MRCRKITVHQIAPQPDRQSVFRLFLPGHLLDAEAELAAREDRPAEKKQQRDFSVSSASKYLAATTSKS